MTQTSILTRLCASAFENHGRKLLLLALIVLVAPCLIGRRAQAQGFSFDGFHDSANCNVITGWAWDANQPNTPIEVDVYSDNVFVATVPANIFRQDLLDSGRGNGIHGFSFTTPESLKDGLQHSIRVRFHNSTLSLFNTPRNINCSITLFQGFHEVANCNTISGWAWDANQPNTSISVDVYLDNDSFRSIVAPANQFRQDLLNAGIGNGVHGFSFNTPAFLKDGHPHSLRIKFTGTTTDLTNTPRSINCGPPPPPFFEGFHELTDCNSISGWAWDALQPNTPINVDIYNGPNLLVSITANQFRQDLLNAGKGNGFHGFTFFVPNSLKDGQLHQIAIGFSGTFTGLFNTPKSITCSPPGGPVYQGFHEVANCTTISGWAWDSTQPNTPISVDIFSDSVLVMTVLADQFRQDLLNAGVGNGAHGFSFTVPNSLKDGLPHSIQVRFGSTSTALNGTPRSITCSP